MSTEHATATDEHLARGEHAHPSPRVYVRIAIYLALATAAEVGLYYMRMPSGLYISLLVFFMVIKFALVALFFMHLKFDSPILRRLFITGILLAITVYLIVLLTFGLLIRR